MPERDAVGRAVYAVAFGNRAQPYEWQLKLAGDSLPSVLIAPTGSGKTAAVTLGWAAQRLHDPENTPRRLVWCLPMRTLVEQTANEVRGWFKRLSVSANLDDSGSLPRTSDIHVLMGGIGSIDWLMAPERPMVLVGTQDMLLSRALMRGYASSRAVWPMEFSLLHHDVQWVFDEVQLMGAGRATSAQLEAFRRNEMLRAMSDGRGPGRPCRSLWISATLRPEWLETVDHRPPTEVMRVDPTLTNDTKLCDLVQAPKHLRRAAFAPQSGKVGDEREYLNRLAASVINGHRSGHMTLVIVNQVRRAQRLQSRVRKLLASQKEPVPRLALLHSRFRQADRVREMAKIRGADGRTDIIVIATQAVEAGVDISAAVMFTELAPWASMVQRFGRANRRAEVEGGADVYWVDMLGHLSSNDSRAERHAITLSKPYEVDELREAREELADLTDVAPIHLPPPVAIDPPLRVVRRRDLDDLFDTDSDLTGFDVDISQWVRDADDTDIRVFWRELPVTSNEPPKPSASELCAVPIGLAKKWIDATRSLAGATLFVQDPQWRRQEDSATAGAPGWIPLREDPWPGMTVMAALQSGGYREDLGFTGDRRHIPTLVGSAPSGASPVESAVRPSVGESEGHDDDSMSETGRPVPLSDHLRHVAHEALGICEALGLDEATRVVVTRAARWHDLGKAHEVFQDTMWRGLNGHRVPEGVLLAKTVKRNLRHNRAYFRHELASALAFLAHENWSRAADLVAFLIAAHHGKVRMNLRALPREVGPRKPERRSARFARGVWEGDKLPALELGQGDDWKGGELTLSVMDLGLDETTHESWTERTRELLLEFGPFQLAWLETLVRIADWRASSMEASGG